MIKKNTNKKIIALIALVAVFLFIFFYFNPSSPTGNTVAVLNKQAHPSLHGNWTISFSTKGTSNLLIKPVNGTSWQDLEPLQLLCGEQPVSFEKTNSHILVEDYSCPKNSKITNKVLTLGVHNLMFNYAGETSYAHNLAGTYVCGVSFSQIAYEFNSSSNKDILSIDCSGNLYIAATSFTNGSGITVPNPNGGFGISNSTHNLFMFNSSHAWVKGSVLDDQTGLSGGSDDVLVRNATNGANLTLFKGTGDLKTMRTAVYDGSDPDELDSCSDSCYNEVCDITTGSGTTGDPCPSEYVCSNGDCESGLLCDSVWECSTGNGGSYPGSGDYKCQGTCDSSGNCDYATNCDDCTDDCYNDCTQSGCSGGSCTGQGTTCSDGTNKCSPGSGCTSGVCGDGVCQECQGGQCVQVNTSWDAQTHNCGSQSRCWQGNCISCGGHLAQGLNQIQCWYLATGDENCTQICADKGGCGVGDQWDDNNNCDVCLWFVENEIGDDPSSYTCDANDNSYQRDQAPDVDTLAQYQNCHARPDDLGASCDEESSFATAWSRICSCNK